MTEPPIRTVCIIGAGVAGLAMAKALDEIGVRYEVHERGSEVGGVWTDGYEGYGVQVPKSIYEMPDFPMPDSVPEFPPGPVVQAYLHDYARQFGIMDHVHLGSDVTAIREDTAKPGWRVTLMRDGKRSTRRFDLVVVCVGLYSNTPYLPEIGNREDYGGAILHNSELRESAILRDHRVAVVGFGKSATDAALLSERLAGETHIIARHLHWPVPRRLAGILPFKWGLLNRMTLSLIPLYKDPTPFERALHRWGRPLIWIYWRLVELLLVVQCGLWSRLGARQSLVPEDPVEIGAFSEATMVPHPEFFGKVRHGRIRVHHSGVQRFTRSGVELSDGTQLTVDRVVFATGWRSDYGFLPPDLHTRLGAADDGFYLYRQMLHPNVPRLAFVGYASTVSNMLAYRMQACWLAALIAGRHALPDADAQRTEIDRMRAWKRSWMPFSHARAARLIVHLQHYLDELMTDMGLDPMRKRGVLAPLAELVAPYQPSDYRTVTATGDAMTASR
ncbi:MAG: NAD(P)/FAD-dependent oxidoreductase [Pseudomonadota bacterium]